LEGPGVASLLPLLLFSLIPKKIYFTQGQSILRLNIILFIKKVLMSLIEVLEVRSKDNIVDIYTKSLSKGSFESLREKLGIISRKLL